MKRLVKKPVKKTRYSVREIDDLRRVCEERYLWGSTYTPPFEPGETSRVRHGRSYKESDKNAAVEEMVRTFMLAGVTAADIRAEDKRRYDEYNSRYAQSRSVSLE
jgi:hypothetical protein